ncbi:MAG: hypothetical protein IJI97_05985 [Clostridia bacterium]|nr:hypothetical protein [Clostridia bacterium]
MSKKDKMVEVLMTGLISREQAEREQESFARLLTQNGKGATHYISISYKGGFLLGKTWEIQLWERGK